MKVLVTGGAGFIGSHVTVKLLDAGHDVIVYDDLSRGFRELVDDRADFVLASLHDQLRLREALRGTDAVVHMAGFIIVPESVEHPEMYYQNNVEGSRSLLEAMEATGVRRIVFSSSATVYGEPDAVPLTEDAPIKEAANPYGQTKIDVEALLHEAHARSGL
ncbi:MAG TPA: NAD-dependent epimerase/dehydratase family protein, partial [Dehalococcoidia bacterium]|nr:NAD-dependent epimerase/dehydratase family protein [Dehalococcoidia bacterium]